eukprot:61312-Rhodomonas_salina.2
MSAGALVSLPIMIVVACSLLCWRRYSKSRPKTRPYEVKPPPPPPPEITIDDPPRRVAAPVPPPATRAAPPAPATRDVLLPEVKPGPQNGSAREEENSPPRSPTPPPTPPSPPQQSPVTQAQPAQWEEDDDVMEAISRGDVGRMKRALATAELGVNDVLDVGTGFTALHTAAAYGREQMAFFLICLLYTSPSPRDRG